jgi:hypothetical protein
VTDTTDKLIIQSETQGVQQSTDQLNQLGKSMDGVTVASQKVEQSTGSVDSKFAALEKRFGTAAGNAAQYAKVQETVTTALGENAGLQDRANEVLAAAAAKYESARSSASGLNSIIDAGRGALIGYAAGLGPIGAVLGSFGPWGTAAAVGIGTVSTALNYMNDKANEAGDSSVSLQKFASNTGLTTTEIRGLTEAGAQLGISSDDVGGAIEKLTVNLAAARQGSGSLYDQLRIIDGGLAESISSTHSSAEALDLLAKAYNSTTDATTKAELARAAFGRGGQASGGVLSAIGDAGGVDAYSASVQKANGVTDEWTKHVAELRNENKSLEESLKLVEASSFTEATLARQNQYLKTQLAIAQSVRDTLAKGGTIAPPGEADINVVGENNSALAGSSSKTDVAAHADVTAAIDAQKTATEGLAQANIDNLNAMIKMSASDAAIVNAMGSGATAAQKEQARIDALTVSFESGKISSETYAAALDNDTSRAAAQITAVGKSWGNVSEQTAVALEASKNQLPVLQAVGGAAKMAAQEAADYANYMLNGKTSTEAAALAASRLEASQAQVNSAAQEQLAALQDQYAVASARNVQEGILAQGQATYNALLRQGVDSTIAMSVAQQQVIDNQAKVFEQNQKSVKASQDQLDLLKAQGTGAEAQVQSSIAYQNAIQNGATAAQAAAISTDTMQASMIKAARAADQMADAEERAQLAASHAQFADFTEGADNAFGMFQPKNGVEGNTAGTVPFWLQQQLQNAPGPLGVSDAANNALGAGGINAAIAAASGLTAGTMTSNAGASLEASLGLSPGFLGLTKSTTNNESDIISTVGSLYDIKNSQTSDNAVKTANLQEELAWLQSRPESIARDQAIAQLTQSMQQLTGATNANTAATVSLNPLYNGRSALQVGYYHAANGLDLVAQGPTTGDQIPFHAMVNGGERITIGPANKASSSSTSNDNSRTIINNITLPPAPTNSARRSQRQFAQGFGQMMASVA